LVQDSDDDGEEIRRNVTKPLIWRRRVTSGILDYASRKTSELNYKRYNTPNVGRQDTDEESA